MDIQRINLHTSAFNEITHYIESDNGKEKVEVWFARELQSVLGYARWENFTIGRTVESCSLRISTWMTIFVRSRKWLHWVVAQSVKSKTICPLASLACYLIAQNGDPKKEEIAFAQGYVSQYL